MEELVDLHWLENELKNNGFYNVTNIKSVEITPAVGDGENYASVLLRLKLKVQQTSGDECYISILLKRKLNFRQLDNKALADSLNRAFIKEYNFYVNVLPKLEKYLKNCQENTIKLWPDCLANVKFKELYIEDLKDSNHILSSRLKGLDNDQCLLVFKSLGQFHAATYMAVNDGLIDIEMYRRYVMIDGTSGNSAKRQNTPYDYISEVILSEWGIQWTSVGEKLKMIKNIIRDKVIDVGIADNSRINVINHGDLWVNNMLFCYNSEKNKPISLKFIDFQCPHYNSFAFDISYFLHTSVSWELKNQFLDKWINVYTENFRKILDANDRQLPSPSDDLVKSELVRIAPFSLNICVKNRPIVMCKPEDSLPLKELVKDNALTDRRRRIYTNPDLAEVLKSELPALLDLVDS